jgi:2-dehydro-3-deoxyphosphooctonate aldolase (KDO 8-P synthase)
LETHDSPDKAPSDGANMIPLSSLESLLKDLIGIDKLIKSK